MVQNPYFSTKLGITHLGVATNQESSAAQITPPMSLTGQTRHRQGGSKIAEIRHRQGGGCQRQGLVFDAKRENMTKIVSSGVKCALSTGCVSTTRGCQRQEGKIGINSIQGEIQKVHQLWRFVMLCYLCTWLLGLWISSFLQASRYINQWRWNLPLCVCVCVLGCHWRLLKDF